MSELLLDRAGRRRSPATMPGFQIGHAPGNKGLRYPADPPKVEEIIAVMRAAGQEAHGRRLRGLIVIMWRAGLRVQEALALTEGDLDQRRGSLLVRRGKGGRGREVGMDGWGWEQLQPWLDVRHELPVGPLLCIINGATRGRHCSLTAARAELRRTPRGFMPRTDARTTRTRSGPPPAPKRPPGYLEPSMQHHEDTLDTYVRRMKADPNAIAVILVGSVARGTERPDSDVDVYLVVPDDVFDSAIAANRVIFDERSDATYPGGYVDVKLATVAFLDAAAERGDDPVRASFEDARVAWVRGGYDIAGRVAAIPVLPPMVWERRAVSFMSQVWWHGTDFLPQAVALDNTFLLHHAAMHTVGAGGRALLALNRTLFRGPRYLDATLATVDRIPDGYSDLARQLITQPSRESADAYVQALEAFHPWPVDRTASVSIFIRDNELAWLTGILPPELS